MMAEITIPVDITRPLDGPHVWEATVRFVTTYDLPDGVTESAVARAVQQAETLWIKSLDSVQSSEG
jgi:hypothetical protein